jgi:hypothetical protein
LDVGDHPSPEREIVTSWERRVIRVLGGAPDPIDAIPGGAKTEDDVNAYVFAANHERPLADVRAAFDGSYQEMLRLIETVPDGVLADQYDWISGNAAEHYDEHLRTLLAWREREVPSATDQQPG